MGAGAFGSSTTSNQQQNQNTSMNYDPQAMAQWSGLLGTGATLVNQILGSQNYPASQMVAPTSDIMGNYYQLANAMGNQVNPAQPANTAANNIGMGMANAYNLGQGFNMPQYNQGSFMPDQGTLNGIAAWGNQMYGNIPQVSTQGMNVGYNNVYAPGAVQQLSGLPQISAPSLNQYQMANVANVGPARSWTDQGVSGQYMSPYTQDVVNAQLAQAKVQEQQQLAQQGAQATQAGAFGGSRQAVEAANTSIGYQQLAAQLQAQGLQNAYTQGMGQFNAEQQLANQINLANQQSGLTQGAQNLAANLQTQGLGAQMNMQGQLANQSTALQAGIANQQAQEFGMGQQLQASLANQAAGIQTGLANAQMGMQAQAANQQAALTAAGTQYQGGLQGALQQQQLGMQGQIAGAQLGSQNALQQQQAQQQAMMNMGQLAQMGGNMNLAGYMAQLQGLGAMGTAAGVQQAQEQMKNNAAYQNWLQGYQLPMQALAALAAMQAMQPVNYNQAMSGTSSGTSTTSQGIGNVIGGLLGPIGSLFAEGGAVNETTLRKKQGLARYKGNAGDLPPAKLRNPRSMHELM
jgi:hypothetical protein